MSVVQKTNITVTRTEQGNRWPLLVGMQSRSTSVEIRTISAFFTSFMRYLWRCLKKITGSNLMEREKYLWGHRDQVLLNKGSWWLTHHYLLTQNPSAWIRQRQRQNNGEMYPLFPLSPTDLVFKVWKCVNIKNNSSISTWSDPEHHTCSEAMSFFRLSLDPF